MTNSIGSDVTIRGSLSSASGLRLAGSIVGDVAVDELTIAGDGQIVGTVEGTEVMVEGAIDGDVGATKLVITSTGRVHGDVTAKAIVIDEGGALEGRCHMGETRGSAVAVEPATATPAVQPAPAKWSA